MNDDALLSRLAPVTDEQAAAMVSGQAFSELAEDIILIEQHRPSAIQARKRARHDGGTRRRHPWAVGTAGAALAAGAAVAVAMIVTAGQPAPGGKVVPNKTPVPRSQPTPAGSAALDAWTVTENSDGTVKVTIREMKDPAGLQAKLRADGVRVVVTASLAWPAACSEWRAGNFRMGGQVIQTENRTGLPSADGTELLIKPSAIPAGALLWFGIGGHDVTRFGKSKNLPAQPGGVMSFAYLTATQACTSS